MGTSLYSWQSLQSKTVCIRNVLKLRKLEEEKAAAQQVVSERQDMCVVGLQTSIRQTFRPVRPQASVKATHSKGERVADDDCQQRGKGHRAGASSNRRAKVRSVHGFMAFRPIQKKLLLVFCHGTS